MKITIKRPENWPILQNNQKIPVIFPAFGILDAEKQKIENFLRNWQLETVFYQAKYPNDLEFLANGDQDRLEELQNAFNDKNSNIIFCGSGGYGSARIIPELLKSDIYLENKIFAGFSDITSLHLAFNNCLNIPTLHSPMLKQIAKGKISDHSIEFLYNILTYKEYELSYNIKPLNKLAKNIGNITLPKLLGGNLSLIQTSIGTDWQINKKGDYSLLIEEYDEKSYAIDRMLNHLKNADIFSNCRAIFIGDISKIDNQNYLIAILDDFVNKLNIPIFNIDNIGHKRDNLAIILGQDINILD
jgi:muramoyltetrapeptide carboxypeptidase